MDEKELIDLIRLYRLTLRQIAEARPKVTAQQLRDAAYLAYRGKPRGAREPRLTRKERLAMQEIERQGFIVDVPDDVLEAWKRAHAKLREYRHLRLC